MKWKTKTDIVGLAIVLLVVAGWGLIVNGLMGLTIADIGTIFGLLIVAVLFFFVSILALALAFASLDSGR